MQRFQQLAEKEELDESDAKEFLVGSSEEDSDEDAEQKLNKIEEYRNKLLGALKGTGEDVSSVFRKRDLRERASGDD